jgi:hypothetical protein
MLEQEFNPLDAQREACAGVNFLPCVGGSWTSQTAVQS